jgi:hypothetical protein
MRYLNGTVISGSSIANSIRNPYHEMDEWRCSRTLVVRKATEEELAVFDRLPRRKQPQFYDLRW